MMCYFHVVHFDDETHVLHGVSGFHRSGAVPRDVQSQLRNHAGASYCLISQMLACYTSTRVARLEMVVLESVMSLAIKR